MYWWRWSHGSRDRTGLVAHVWGWRSGGFGGYGYIKEYPMERYLRDSRVHRILEGTNDIRRVIIARRMLATQALPIL